MDGNLQRVAEQIGPEVQPGQEVMASIPGPGQVHDGHIDGYLVSRDMAGNLNVSKQHNPL